jgi:hypothetical protein
MATISLVWINPVGLRLKLMSKGRWTETKYAPIWQSEQIVQPA